MDLVAEEDEVAQCEVPLHMEIEVVQGVIAVTPTPLHPHLLI